MGEGKKGGLVLVPVECIFFFFFFYDMINSKNFIDKISECSKKRTT